MILCVDNHMAFCFENLQKGEFYHCYRSSMCDVVAIILPEWHIKDGKWYKIGTETGEHWHGEPLNEQ